MINLLKPAGYVIHQQFNIQQLYALPTLYLFVLYMVIRKSMKHLKNSQQMDYSTDHGNSYVHREREKLLNFFFKEKPAHIVALICR